MTETCQYRRLFIGGLFKTVNCDELKERLQRYGKVESLELKSKHDSSGEWVKTFAYANTLFDVTSWNKCKAQLHGAKWKGSILNVQEAKEDIAKRYAEERKLTTQSSDVNSAEIIPTEFPGAVPGFHLPEHKNWVVTKFQRVVPIMNIRTKDKKKLIQYDPSKHSSQIRRLDTLTNKSKNKKQVFDDDDEVPITQLTWQLGEDKTIETRSGSKVENKFIKKGRSAADVIEEIQAEKQRLIDDLEVVSVNAEPGEMSGVNNYVDSHDESSSDTDNVLSGYPTKASGKKEYLARKKSSFVTASNVQENQRKVFTEKNGSTMARGIKSVRKSRNSNCKNQEEFSISVDENVIQEKSHVSSATTEPTNTASSASTEPTNTASSATTEPTNTASSATTEPTNTASSASTEPTNTASSATVKFTNKISAVCCQSSESDDSSIKSLDKNAILRQTSTATVNANLSGDNSVRDSSDKKSITVENANTKSRSSLSRLPSIQKTENQVATKHNKHKDSNFKRIEAVRKQQDAYKQKQKAIQEALNQPETSRPNKRKVFESSDSEEHEDDDKSKMAEQNGLTLFESDEDVNEDYEKRFAIKPQFEGTKGAKLFNLQQNYKDDTRFNLSEKFISSDSDDSTTQDGDATMEEVSDELDERRRNLEILRTVVGSKHVKVAPKKTKKSKPADTDRTVFRDLVHYYYDPTDEKCIHMEKSMEITKKPKKKKKLEGSEPVIGNELAPEVSKERFYDVGVNFTDSNEEINKSDFSKSEGGMKFGFFDNESDLTAENAKMSDQVVNSGVDDSKVHLDRTGDLTNETALLKKSLNQFGSFEDKFNYESESDHETKEPCLVPAVNKGQVHALADWFLFTPDDPRVDDGMKYFSRTLPPDELRKRWKKIRNSLVKNYLEKKKKVTSQLQRQNKYKRFQRRH